MAAEDFREAVEVEGRRGLELGAGEPLREFVETVADEGWTASGEWIGVPYVDQGVAELLLRHRHKVIRLLEGAGLLEEDRVRLLLSWRHTGFSVHN